MSKSQEIKPFTVLLADDECLTRTGISFFLSKMDGYTIIGEACNGEEAIEKVLSLHPHIMILDIKMPILSGIEVLERLSAIKYHNTKILITSGYDDFDFVRKAMQLGSSDYLLKPISFDQLEASLNCICEELENETNQKREEKDRLTYVNLSYPFMLEQFYRKLIDQEYIASSLQDKIEILGLPEKRYCVMLISPDYMYQLVSGWDQQSIDQVKVSISTLIASFIETEHLEFSCAFQIDHTYNIIVVPDDIENIEILAESIQKYLNEKMQTSITIAIGDVLNLQQLHNSFKSAKLKLRQRFFIDDNSIIKHIHSEIIETALPLQQDFEKNIVHAIKYHDETGAKSQLMSFFTETQKLKIPQEEWIRFSYETAISIMNLLGNYSIGTQGIDDLIIAIKDIANLASIHDILDWLNKFINAAMVKIHTSVSGQPLIIRKALGYIEDHYKEDISLYDISKHISLSTNYFCNLFKQETGRTVLECITMRRMQEAKHLLKTTQLNISEIAFLLGYENPRYFSEVFRRFESVTPTRYRKSL